MVGLHAENRLDHRASMELFPCFADMLEGEFRNETIEWKLAPSPIFDQHGNEGSRIGPTSYDPLELHPSRHHSLPIRRPVFVGIYYVTSGALRCEQTPSRPEKQATVRR